MLWKEFLKLLMSDLLSELEFHVNMRIICYMKCRCEEKLGKTVHSYFYSDLMAMFMMRTAIPYRPWITTEIKLRRGALRLSLTTSTLYTTLRKKGDFHVGYEKLPPPFSLFSLSLAQRCRHPCWTSHRRTVPIYVHVCVCYVLINVLSRFCNFKHEGFILIIFFCFEALTKTKQKNQSALKRGKSHWLKSLKFNERIETMMNIFTFQEKGGGESATSLCVRMRWIYLPWRLKSLFFFK